MLLQSDTSSPLDGVQRQPRLGRSEVTYSKYVTGCILAVPRGESLVYEFIKTILG